MNHREWTHILLEGLRFFQFSCSQEFFLVVESFLLELRGFQDLLCDSLHALFVVRLQWNLFCFVGLG